ncbi:lipase family protein [Aerophototrophica crusticola]|uniref:Lipase family protein n=1 Tax=Aerophototrophica crusticola TaxID=1709002 RepID=A0A858R8Z3_9PROT|nr:lipase family protein [Rhodospirillaceae bacterium B3]
MSSLPSLPASVFQGTDYGLVWLGLANAAYIQQGTPDTGVIARTIQFAFNPTDGNTYIPNPPTPAGMTGAGSPLQGYWNVDWGPGITADNSNLLYLVSFRQGTRPAAGGAQGAPYFFAVAIRGTDISTGRLALLQQVLQDFDAVTKVPLSVVLADPLVPNPAKKLLPPLKLAGISIGTSAGFTRMSALQSSYVDPSTNTATTGPIAAALLANLNFYKGVPLVVTGHSLGGCQTQIMATYLAWQLSDTDTAKAQAIYPNAIAPSTAGDAGFASYYDSLFPYGHFWFNQLDLVPCGFANLATIFTLWQKSKWPPGSVDPATNQPNGGTAGPRAPDVLTLLSATLGPEILLQNYTRPKNGLVPMSNGLPPSQTILEMLQDMAEPAPLTATQPTADQAALAAAMADGFAGTELSALTADLEGKKTLAQKATDGLSMLMWQHFMPCYYQLISSQTGVLPYASINDKDVPQQSNPTPAAG